ncbi:anther-specific protein RTS-like [Miscanthus floridulus]|uniref:anther-specific protein RTS-like n=1 Tax=Miscanthus floridulus TaxID=154761 RepID=UPI0034599705
MKAVDAAVLLLLALVVAPAVNADHDGHHHHHHRGHGGHRRSSVAGLTQCVTICGSRVTSCMLDCYQPLIDLDPVELPVCLLKCTNHAMICASGCPVTGNV